MTTKYPKIQTIFKRGEKKKIIEGEWTLPEFEYLQNNEWIGTEKIDGTNIRIGWEYDKKFVTLDGRTENAQLSSILVNHLIRKFPRDRFDIFEHDIGLYGEGFGQGIQGKFGKAYTEGYLSSFLDCDDKNGFILFDVKIDTYWLKREDVKGIAKRLNIDVVPIVGEGTLDDLINYVQGKPNSVWGNFTAEGVVARPKIELKARNGQRIITKLKYKDFHEFTKDEV